MAEEQINPLTRRSVLGAAGLAALAALAGSGNHDASATRTDPTSEGTPGMRPSPHPSNGAKMVLVYFSRPGENYWEGGRRDLEVGNTKKLAQMITDRIDCEKHEILAADPYPEAYDPTVKRNVEEQDSDTRPGIRGQLPDLTRYDIIMIGSPVWNVRAPMIMSTFIDGVDLKGKTVLPFVTYAVSGMAGVDQAYRDALPGSDMRDGLAVHGEDVDRSGADVEEWLRTNGLL